MQKIVLVHYLFPSSTTPVYDFPMINPWLGVGHRSSVQIAAAVLKLSNGRQTTKSEVMDSVKMSHQQTQKYLDWLVERQLLDIVRTSDRRSRYRYLSTSKGQTLVSILDQVQQMLDSQSGEGPPPKSPIPGGL